MTKTKFVKRYPRAIIKAVKFPRLPLIYRLHLLEAPGTRPHRTNRISVAWPEDLHELYPQAALAVAAHRSEPS